MAHKIENNELNKDEIIGFLTKCTILIAVVIFFVLFAIFKCYRINLATSFFK
jgi:hypothetical protein